MTPRRLGTRSSAALAALTLAIPLIGWGSLQAPQALAQNTAATDDPQWGQDLSAWRALREQEVSAPDGWLTLIGMDWLKPGINSVGAAPGNQIPVRALAPEHIGLFTVSGKTALGSPTVQILSPSGGFPPDFTMDGRPAREGPLAFEGAKPPTFAWHGLTLAVLNRGGRFALRIKDAGAPTRTGFHGLNWYAPDPRYRINALWVPFSPSRIEKISTVLGTTQIGRAHV